MHHFPFLLARVFASFRRQITLVVTASAIALLLSACGGGTSARPIGTESSYPDHTLTIIVPFAPGSATDLEARVLAKLLEQRIHQPVVVTDRPGANTAIGMSELLSSPANGYSLMLTTDTTLFLIAAGKSPYKLTSVRWVARLNGEPSALMVKNGTYSNLAKFIASANAGPVTVGGPGLAAHQQLVMSEIAKATHISYKWVAYSGGSSAVASLLGGHVAAIVEGPSSARAEIDAGQIRILGVSGPDSAFKAAPTFLEQGYHVIAYQWRGIVVSPSTPPKIVTELSDILHEISQSTGWSKEYLQKYGNSNMFLTGKSLQSFIQGQYLTIKRQYASLITK